MRFGKLVVSAAELSRYDVKIGFLAETRFFICYAIVRKNADQDIMAASGGITPV
jgi:hypothetical protein